MTLTIISLASAMETTPADLTTTMCLQILGIADTVEDLREVQLEDLREVQSAFRAAALRCHPDRGGSQQKFTRLQKAKDILTETFAHWQNSGFRARWCSFACHELNFSHRSTGCNYGKTNNCIVMFSSTCLYPYPTNNTRCLPA
jgi:hypothetical protein